METLQPQNTYKEAVVINVDVQNDFCPGGSLAVANGDEVIHPLNDINKIVASHGGAVIYTADWHSPDTKHFISNGGEWPTHCIAGSQGAELHDTLVVLPESSKALKGMDPDDDGYSGAHAIIQDGQLLELIRDEPPEKRTVEIALKRIEKRVRERHGKFAILIGGLATDYCVKATVLDILRSTDRETTDVIVILDAIRAVNIQPHDGDQAIRAMKEAGAIALTLEEIKAQILIEETDSVAH